MCILKIRVPLFASEVPVYDLHHAADEKGCRTILYDQLYYNILFYTILCYIVLEYTIMYYIQT